MNETERDDIATPANTRVVFGVVPPTLAMLYASSTDAIAPPNEIRGSKLTPPVLKGASSTMASAPARPAPDATPSRYGSAKGFRNTPWYAAPLKASEAPTAPASSTRGTLISQTIASTLTSTA